MLQPFLRNVPKQRRDEKLSNILSIPVRGNEKLQAVLDFVDEDIELQTLWRCANVLAVNRLGYNDHGPVHVKIVANGALKMLRILGQRGVEPSIGSDYGMSAEDAEVVVVLASIMHDLGMASVREAHEIYSAQIALDILRRCLPAVYTTEETTVVSSEIIHAIVSHHAPSLPLTIEAGIVKIADALDMEKGRARVPYEKGRMDIHSVSATSIESVSIEEGEEKPITILIEMTNPSGIFQVDNLLGAKIKGSGLERYVHVEARVKEGEEIRVVKFEI
ncbi:MAG: HD domain-containing protein [Candidatus Bathyarchaeota archaeon]|nr:MAG: HD domain-containing protein [Candidatus Bathyarchaeota archaeon]